CVHSRRQGGWNIRQWKLSPGGSAIEGIKCAPISRAVPLLRPPTGLADGFGRGSGTPYGAGTNCRSDLRTTATEHGAPIHPRDVILRRQVGPRLHYAPDHEYARARFLKGPKGAVRAGGPPRHAWTRRVRR